MKRSSATRQIERNAKANRSQTKADNQKGRKKEKVEFIGSLNIKRNLKSATRLCANDFKFRPLLLA